MYRQTDRYADIQFHKVTVMCVFCSGEIQSVFVHISRRDVRLHQCFICHGETFSVSKASSL